MEMMRLKKNPSVSSAVKNTSSRKIMYTYPVSPFWLAPRRIGHSTTDRVYRLMEMIKSLPE